MVTLISGANSDDFDVAGKSIAEVRVEFGGTLNIAGDSVATISGETVGEDYLLEDGDVVNFIRRTAQKG